MAQPFAHTAAPAPCFTIAEDDAGGWIARERRSGLERRFPSQRAALHFVLFDLDAAKATALLTPRATGRR